MQPLAVNYKPIKLFFKFSYSIYKNSGQLTIRNITKSSSILIISAFLGRVYTSAYSRDNGNISPRKEVKIAAWIHSPAISQKALTKHER